MDDVKDYAGEGLRGIIGVNPGRFLGDVGDISTTAQADEQVTLGALGAQPVPVLRTGGGTVGEGATVGASVAA